MLLLASAAAVLVTGLIGTALVLAQLGGGPDARSPRFWVGLAAAAALTIASLMLRSLRWIFLLRRAQVRIPIRDAYIGYFAGLSLLLTPFLLGEIAVRAAVLRARGRVPTATVVVVNLWERLLDLVALGIMAGVLAIALGRLSAWSAVLLALCLLTAVPPVLRACRLAAEWLARPAAHLFDQGQALESGRLSEGRTWLVGIVASLVAWSLPGLGFWLVANGWERPFSLVAGGIRLRRVLEPRRPGARAGRRAGRRRAAARRAAGRGPGRGSGGGFRVRHPAGDGGRGDDARHGVPARPCADATCGGCGALRRDRRRLRRADSRIEARRVAREENGVDARRHRARAAVREAGPRRGLRSGLVRRAHA